MTTTERPAASTAVVRRRMQRQQRSGTGIELALRRELWRRGLRYRVQKAVIDPRRRHDIVFTRAHVVVDVRGCFWHGCPAHATQPKANARWWREKISANRTRDADTERRRAAAGWECVVVWEHDDVRNLADLIGIQSPWGVPSGLKWSRT